METEMKLKRENKKRLKTHLRPSSYMPILRLHSPRFHERHISSVTFTSAHPYSNVYMWVGMAHTLADLSDFGLLGEQRYKMGDCLPRTPMNRHAEYDAAVYPRRRNL